MGVRVSVIMPLYNKADYVERAINSVLQQSFCDWELIVVDDGSTDRSADVVSDMLNILTDQQRSQIRLIRQSNIGVAQTRNNAVWQANGTYLAFLDADDWWDQNFLQEMNLLAGQYPDAGLYASNYIYYRTGKTRIGVKHFVIKKQLSDKAVIINYPLSYCENDFIPVWTGAVMMPKSVFEECGGFLKDIRLGEDFLLWAAVAQRYPIVFMDKPLSYYNHDVPVSLRATRNLHQPQYHLLWHMQLLETAERTNKDWKQMCDKVRVGGLRPYWLDEQYHNMAVAELRKVDWTLQPTSVKQWYDSPLWLLRCMEKGIQIGSEIKTQLRSWLSPFMSRN